MERSMLNTPSEKMELHAINVDAASPEAMQKIVHQLQVHQIELEMQNEELRRTQLQLETARLRYFDLYDLAPVGYCTLSEHGLILEANLMAAKMFDSSRSDLVNKPISSFIFKADQDIYYLHRKQLIASGEPQSYELRILNSSRVPVWIHVTATYERDADGVPLLRKVMTDITARKESEAALRESEERAQLEQTRLNQILHNYTAKLERATVVAEKANLAKSDFLSSMSHELRTPLGAILGFAQLIDSDTPPPTLEQKRNVDQILQAGWYLLDLINEILDLALIESGKLSISLESLALAEVMRDCQTMIEPQSEKYKIHVNFPEFKFPYFVHADRTRLKQILINLMSNAIKYNKPNGTVIINCIQKPNERIRICVEDSGEGLTPDQIAQLFQPFNRLGQEHNSKEGTGIGLVMTKRLIELMGGEIGLESTPGQGSIFWVEIGLTDQPQVDAVIVDATSDTITNTQLRQQEQQTLLYVEDNPANLMLVQGLIARRPHFNLISALDGPSGIALARTAQPKIILMDINLPGMSGVDALKILLTDPITAHIPVIALSANAIPSDIENGLQAGFFSYLTKPIKIDEFMNTLEKALEFATELENSPVIRK